MDVVEVEIPIHRHLVTPLKERRMGNCCGIKFKAISDGYFCSICNFFFHKTCSNAPKEINHPSDQKCEGTLSLQLNCSTSPTRCGLCAENIGILVLHFTCWCCHLNIHLDCAKYPPPKVIHVPEDHNHELKLETVRRPFKCAACGKYGTGYPYKCHECYLEFHVHCRKYAAEVNHPLHSLHPLKLFYGEPPAYTDGKCRLCGKKPFDDVFYHCSKCKFTLDLPCVFNSLPLNLDDQNIHRHTLTLMPKSISFTCTACGLDGDRSPYFCVQCDFMAHNDCSGYPRVININRHDHRVSRTSNIGVVNSVCGVCRKKMDWSCGGYFCQKCPDTPDYVFHTKCATRKDVWDGLEMEGKPEEDEDIEPFKRIDENTIQHYSHKEHHLIRLENAEKYGISIEELGSCEACAYPIYHESFYWCTICDFNLHSKCAEMPTRKRHVVSNMPYLLHNLEDDYSKCDACGVFFNGFVYGYAPCGIDVRCASISGSFLHRSHQHPLFYTSPEGVCSACNKASSHVLRCVDENCHYILDFKCALLPYEVKHRVDDHILSLCFGEKEDASGKYWCDICEKQTNPKKWFYTCKDCGLALHTNCVLGDFRGLKPRRQVRTRADEVEAIYVTVQNNSMSRPRCYKCKSRCIFPIILKTGNYFERHVKYFCSINCCNIESFGSLTFTASAFRIKSS